MNIHDFTAKQKDGNAIDLKNYKGKVLLIVNTASKCTFTPQFEDLQRLYVQYKEAGLEILGFPCNQFGGQEPGSNEEAAEFCQLNYGVAFPIFSKVEVNGENADPLFQYLREFAPFRGFDDSNINEKLLKMMIADRNPEWLVGDSIKWNFTKFLIDSNGTVIKRFEPSDGFSSIQQHVESLLI
ncbi:glutathione peroxidase [Pseudobacillus wudalianchiensis]|uniref:Glutathione peroxidase n=1 Tax=Pseudobacillus wudalianchiensis TaxID=1743143 RepID=A0A1B9AZ89_9BACI|nr:glutathione peroxidase [Bacillus wudalianchiensis]OCA89058.1 glutathione peroxidase [Bacillus wudalianchiensis]